MTREEAIKEIKMWGIESPRQKEALETLIPELRENEDEWIRKALIDALKVSETVGELKFRLPEPTREKAIAYLENQKPSFRQIHDSVMWDNGLRTGIELGKQKEQKDYNKLYENIGKSEWFEKAYEGKSLGCDYEQKEQKPIKWTDLTWKDIVELEGIINNVHYDFSAGIGQESFGKEVLERFRSTKGIEYLDEAEQKCWREEEQKPAWSVEDKAFLKVAIAICNKYSHKDTADWLKSLPERFNLQPKVEWSEEDIKKIRSEEYTKGFNDAAFGGKLKEWSKEDENMAYFVNQFLEYHENADPTAKSCKKWFNNRFKSLKPHWKPSEEQMEALKDAVRLFKENHFEKFHYKIESLYEQLLKVYERGLSA